jgi:hypothetical protein
MSGRTCAASGTALRIILVDPYLPANVEERKPDGSYF